MGAQRAPARRRTRQGRAHRANGALTSVNTTAPRPSPAPRSSPATSPARTPTATRWRRRWPTARRCASAWRARCSASSAGRSDDSVNARAVVRRPCGSSSGRPAGEVRRGAGRVRPQPPVRPTERPVSSKRSATRRSFLRAVGAGATALPFYRLLEDSVAQARRRAAAAPLLRHLPPARHRRRVLSAMLNGRFSGMSTDTETSFNLTYTNNSTQCSLQPFDDAATYGKSFKSKILADRRHRPDVERQRPRHGGHDPDRQPHRGRQAQELVARSVPGGRAQAGRGDAGHQHRRRRRRRAHAGRDQRCRSAPAARRCPRSSTPCRRSTRCSPASSPPTIRRRRPRRCATAPRAAASSTSSSRTSTACTRGWRRPRSKSWSSTWMRSATWRSSSRSRRWRGSAACTPPDEAERQRSPR